MGKFHLVDFAAHYQQGFRNHVVSISEVAQLVRNFKSYGCYSTYFFFSDEIVTYMSTQAGEAKPSVAGYGGKVWAPFLPLDLDHPDLTLALEAARLLCSFVLERWKIDPRGIQVYFSGSKGFHLMLDSRLFGKILPSKNLPMIFDAMRRRFAFELPEYLRDTVDFSIKDRVRLLRLPNTTHEKSQLQKVILSLDEVDHLKADEIREIARTARPLTLTDETGLISRVELKENRQAGEFFRRIGRQLKRLTRKPFPYRFARPTDLGHLDFPCAGVQKIWESHVEPGYRNNSAIRLASELRLMGLSADEVNDKLFEWNESNQIELPSDEIQNVVRSAYQHRFPYRFSCRDEILRRFCPLANYEACRVFTTEHAGAVASSAPGS
jgi:hypothetical protein